MPRLLSVNVGLPRDVTWNGKTVRTSVWKSPVDGRRMVHKLESRVMRKPISPVTAGNSAPFLFTRWTRTIMAQVVHTPHLPQGPPGSGPPVSFARSGITVARDSKFTSLLELAEACDVPVRWSCRTGVCHTYMTGLIGGSVTYNPEPLERPAPGNVLVCCSQPNAGVTLDL
jgi:ferredoxin